MTTKAVVEHMDRESLDGIMTKLAANQREIDRIEIELNEGIARLQAEAKERAKEYVAAVETGTVMLKAAAKANRKELFGEGKTLKLTHGEINFRSSTGLALSNKSISWDNVLAGLTEDGRLDAVRVIREVNKDVLRTWPSAALARYDVKLRTTETVRVDPDRERIGS